MKKLFTSIFSVAVALSSALNVQASLNVAYESSSRTVTVSGNAQSDKSVPVTVHMYKAITDFPCADNLPVASTMTRLNGDGDFEVVFDLPENVSGGKYHILCGHIETEKTSFILYNPDSDETKSVVAALNNAKTVNDFSAVCQNADKMALVGMDLGKEVYTDEMIKNVFSVKKDSFGAEDYIYAFNYMRTIAQINDAENADSVLENSASSLGGSYEDYAVLSENVKKEINIIFDEYNFGNGMITLDAIMVVAFIRSASNYDDVLIVIEKNAELLNIDFKNYNKLSINAKHKAPRAVYKNASDLLCPNDVKVCFDNAVEDALNDDSDDNGSSSSRPSSGGGGGGSVVGVSQSFIQENNTTAEQTEMFSDILNHFAKNDIEKLASAGVINGYEDSTFRPDNFITRAEFSAIVSRAFDVKGVSESEFIDVNKNDWYYSSVGAMKSKGYIEGDGERFFPQNNITRQDAAVILARIIGADNGKCTYSDSSDISDYAKAKVGALFEKGYMQGYENLFRPLDYITRGEVVALINRICSDIGGLGNE